MFYKPFNLLTFNFKCVERVLSSFNCFDPSDNFICLEEDFQAEVASFFSENFVLFFRFQIPQLYPINCTFMVNTYYWVPSFEIRTQYFYESCKYLVRIENVCICNYYRLSDIFKGCNKSQDGQKRDSKMCWVQLLTFTIQFLCIRILEHLSHITLKRRAEV